MYQALYRKYRPQTFESVIAQDVVKKILVNSIKNDKISHAYLFSGSRGIGKTSIAKIFAKAVNCLQFEKHDDVCLECENCLDATDSVDILEIDAASNNGVEQIRELKSKVNIVPSKLKYKVYIIDEVHMLSNSAFNALLKTLEEPPSHVIFILATTEFFEVPETIVSRCQCYSFSRITNDDLVKRLKYICQEEKIKIDEETLVSIAEYANGGMRDAISMLDKLASFTNNDIKIDDFILINGLVSQEDIKATYHNILANNFTEVLETINKINENGYNFENFIERLMIYIRDEVIANYLDKKADFSLKENVYIINKLNDLLNVLKTSLSPIVMMQVTLLEIIEYLHPTTTVSQETTEKTAVNPQKIKDTKKKEISKHKDVENKESIIKSTCIINETVKETRINNALANANLAFKKAFLAKWSELQKYRLDDKYAKVIQLLGLSTPMIVSDQYVVIASDSEGVVERMFSSYEDIEQLLLTIYGNSYRVVFTTTKDFENIKNKYINDKKNGIIYTCQPENERLVEISEKKENELLSKALSVFGSELVEMEDE